MEFITKAVIESIERGWVPDGVTRALTRRLCDARLRELRRENISTEHFAGQMKEAPIAPVPEKANEQHYELPAEFFELMLGPRLKYSCCYFEDENTDLGQAEVAALSQTCERAELEDGMHILELGCGWGSLTLWMLEKYPHAKVTAISNSRWQRELILSRAKKIQAEDRLTVITADMNDFQIDQRFDRVVSCEMFEHMRNYQELLQRVAGWLNADGKLFVHIFCHEDFVYEFESEGASNWMGRYFFTGGIMPSFDIFGQFKQDMRVRKSWSWNGTHYERTCNAWLELLDERKEPAMEILQATYGAKEAARWWRRWRLFLIAGAELFGFQNGQQWLVGHYLLEPTAKFARASEELIHQ